MSAFRILLQVSGSIGAFKAVALCSKLSQLGFEIEVVLSKGAEEFVGAASFEGFTHRKVHRGNFDEGTMMDHIELERWADLILLYPATANTVSDLANGKSESLIGSIFLAHEFKKPYWVVPAMNQAMVAHPAYLENIKKLSSWGLTVLAPVEGQLACGEIGAGRLIEPEEMILKIQNFFSTYTRQKKLPNQQADFKPELNQKSPLRILITSGGTSEPIDGVRSITNFSTGKLAL